MSPELQSAATSLQKALASASASLVEREAVVQLVGLCAVASEHVLVIGPPGTAKSEAVRRVARALGGKYFEYLLGRFTEPTEVFGPVDLKRLKEGVVETQTDGMLPEADLAFLDEVFLGSTAILNTLLGILNERTFRRGHTRMTCPLRVCVGASNALPQDEMLAAFADRFLARIFLTPLPDARLEELLGGGWSLEKQQLEQHATLAELALLADAVKTVDVTHVRGSLAHCVRLLRQAGIQLTDRRVVRVQRLVAAAAILAGRDRATEADLWPILYALPTADAQALGRDVLGDVLRASENAALPAAAEEASLGPLARAHRLAGAAGELLDAPPEEADVMATQAWRLKLEGVAREMDAGFPPEQLPENLKTLRQRISDAVGDA
ncbi:MAG: AAA family ATPase [Myxococcaceae bacterium]|nr:AAA family ATPase [Myxococcaceae bacterium]